MKIALTICSANYLPFAKALGDSLIQHNPDYTFIIVLVDTFAGFDRSFFHPHTIISINELSLADFEEMNGRYTIFELSCAMKPYVIDWFVAREPEAEVMAYFDSDILVYAPFTEMEKTLQQHAVLLTPHICTPLPDDGNMPDEEVLLKAGLYNAGFFAVRPSKETAAFLSWWKMRMKDRCFNSTHEDQLWLNLVPVYFPQTAIFGHSGYNVAYWNFHERHIQAFNAKYVVNAAQPLVFFHYSGFNIHHPESISKHQNRYSFENKPELLPLYRKYADDVLKNNVQDYFSIVPGYGTPNPEPVAVEEVAPPVKRPFSTTRFLRKLFGITSTSKEV